MSLFFLTMKSCHFHIIFVFLFIFFCLALISIITHSAQAIELEFDAIRGHKSAHSFATGPVMAEPFISPLLLTITPALSSKYKNTPSRLLNGLRCRMTTAGITYFSNTQKRRTNSIYIAMCRRRTATNWAGINERMR